METQICIIGAGPAGLTAAIFAAQRGAQVLVVERNTTAGRKLLKTGRGRCNLTHMGSIDDFVRAYGSCGRFLKPALYAFPPQQVRDFFHSRNVPTQEEKDGCVFPVSNKASDVCKCLLDAAQGLGVVFLYGRHTEHITANQHSFEIRTNKETIFSRAVILATGGATWPMTGSTGDGYRLAADFGHSIIAPKPALCPLVTEEKWPGCLQGLGIPQVRIRAAAEGRRWESEGPLMFTSDGIGGPAVFDLSRHLTDILSHNEKPVPVHIDWLPELDSQALENRLLAEFTTHPKKEPAGILSGFLPRQTAQQMQTLLLGNEKISVSQMTRQHRKNLLNLLKNCPLTIVRTAPLEQATITRGGVSRNEIDPTTMESRLQSNLFFAGEVLDADGPCGGYNLQIAWSTGALSGLSAAKK
ncbi:MAG TPA: NAD(P)/FAD-dependent oxidoreductase [Anaerohalosphaeraceae bacterium]|nr:NAD(P)/FAD-dependent oxidoreductase [Anaerohalosphaeraceae bacterium]